MLRISLCDFALRFRFCHFALPFRFAISLCHSPCALLRARSSRISVKRPLAPPRCIFAPRPKPRALSPFVAPLLQPHLASAASASSSAKRRAPRLPLEFSEQFCFSSPISLRSASPPAALHLLLAYAGRTLVVRSPPTKQSRPRPILPFAAIGFFGSAPSGRTRLLILAAQTCPRETPREKTGTRTKGPWTTSRSTATRAPLCPLSGSM